MGREGMRASDGDRQQVVDQLKTALGEGRLDLHEFDERIQLAYGAKTYGDLDTLLHDLPGTVPPQRSQVEPRRAVGPVRPIDPVAKERGKGPGSNMLGVFAICMLVWAFSSFTMGGFAYFWPGWMLIPVAIAVLARRNGRDKRADRD